MHGVVAITLLVLTIVSFATAQTGDVICFAERRNNLGETCNTFDASTFTFTTCKSSRNDGIACVSTSGISGTCVRLPRLNQACSNSTGACYDPDFYDITCFDGICKYPPGTAPGETCPTTPSNYLDGRPCAAFGRECSNNCGTVVAAGGSCDNSENFCPRGQYCSNGTCVARKANGAECSTTVECDFTTRCSTRGGTTRRCTTFFSQTAGQSCQDVVDCDAGLYCSSSGVCVQPTSRGQACLVLDNDDTCPNDYSCVCDGGRGSVRGKCEILTLPRSLINDYNSFAQCMKDNCVLDIGGGLGVGGSSVAHTATTVSYVPDSCPARSCGRQYTNVLRFIDSLGDAQTISISMLVLLVAALALLF